MIYTTFLDYCQQNIFNKYVKLIFFFAKKIGKSKGCKFFNVLNYVYSEIVKLNRVEFTSKPLVSEEAEAKHKDRTSDKQGPIDYQFTNNYLNIEYQLEQQQKVQHHQQQH